MIEVMFTVIALAACYAAWLAGIEIGKEMGAADYAAKIKGEDDHCRFSFGKFKDNRED